MKRPGIPGNYREAASCRPARRIDRKAYYPRGEGGKVQSEGRQAEVNQEELDEKRRSPDNINIGSRGGPNRRQRDDPEGADENSQKGAEKYREQGSLYGHLRPGKKHVKIGDDGGKIKRHNGMPPFRRLR